MRSAGVIFAHSRNFCSAVFVSAGFAVSVDLVGLAAGVATAPGNEMDMMGYGLRIERALSSKPRAIQQHFETTALSEIDRVFGGGKNCRNRSCWKILPGGF